MKIGHLWSPILLYAPPSPGSASCIGMVRLLQAMNQDGYIFIN